MSRTPAQPSTAPATRILMVCTGNVCRSPAAELLLRARLGNAPDVHVSSAGTAGLVGQPVDPPMAGLILSAGVEPRPFTARQLVVEDVRAADLVLVMERTHRALVARLDPSAVRRTLLLVEAAALAAAVRATGWPSDVPPAPAARLAALPRVGALHRGSARLPSEPEVTDPYRRGPGDYARAMEQIESAVAGLTDAVL